MADSPDVRRIAAFPLAWPAGYAVTSGPSRKRSAFQVLSVERSRKELLNQLKLMGAREIVVSSNLALRNDGVPFAGAKVSANLSPGVAVYFMRREKNYVFACDTFRTIEENMRALFLSVKAFRDIQRFGASDMLERAFTGFAALPPAGGAHEHWSVVLGLGSDASSETIKVAYRELARVQHPDNGGDAETFSRITRAYEEAQKDRNFQ